MTCCEIWKSKVRITTWLQRLDGSASKSFVWLCSCDVAVESDPLGCTLVKLAASLWFWAPAGKWVVPFWGQNEARLLCLMSKSIWTLCSATGHYKLVFYYLVLIEAVACPGCVLFNGCVSVLACAMSSSRYVSGNLGRGLRPGVCVVQQASWVTAAWPHTKRKVFLRTTSSSFK